MITWKTFYVESPFTKAKKDKLIHGWHSDSDVFYELLLDLIKDTNPSIIIEVGSWYGQSALKMAEICEFYGLNTKIMCIDTWLGGEEHWDPTSPFFDEYFQLLQIKNGRPEIYEQFISNVIHEKKENMIIPIPNTSRNAYLILRKRFIVAELIYIDGSHLYEDVISDLNNYWELLKPNGVIFGDDYGFPGVSKAVNEFIDSKKIKAKILSDNFFIINKNNDN